jgi:transcriptional regulator with XRE-family HTH domain
VPDHGSPTVHRRRLAAELRRLRERAGLTGAQAAERLEWSVSKISRVETGRSGISQDDLARLLKIYHVGETSRAELLALAREPTRATVDEAAIVAFAAGYGTYVEAEAEAVTIWDWEPQVVPGLLQTAAYAREVMRGWYKMFQLPPADLELQVQARMARQHLLTQAEPLRLTAVIDESVVRRSYGDSRVMHEQLDRLAESSDLANVDLRVLPLGGSHPISSSSFTYMRFSDVYTVSLPDVVVVELLNGNNYIDDVNKANEYRVAFLQLMTEALNPAESRDLIVRAAGELWS